MSTADRGSLERAFRDVGARQSGFGSWLGPRNRYLTKTTLRTNDKTSPQIYRQLVQYIAASAPLHAADSARYLGRSLFCHAINDTHAARHFAYYAELRAAMSILASEGVGVFDTRHYVVTGPAKLETVRDRGTHKYVWEALEEWSRGGRAETLVKRVVRLNGRPLDVLLGKAFPGMSLHVAASWFATWGLDLHILSDDQKNRNTSSYRPMMLQRDDAHSPSQASRDLRALWEAFEPAPASSFRRLDDHLVRLAFEQQAKKVARRRTKGYEKLAHDVATASGAFGPEEELLAEFLVRGNESTAKDLRLIAAARENQDKRTEWVGHFSMISRAALLLRFALGATVLLITDSGLQLSAFQHWLKTWAIRSSVSASERSPSDTLALWEDVNVALDDVQQCDPGVITFAEMLAKVSTSIVLLGECERIALWALAG